MKRIKEFLNSVFKFFGVEIKLISKNNAKNELKHQWIKAVGVHHILDIGANEGQFAKNIRRYFPNARIDSFEPIDHCFEQLKNNFITDKNLYAHNCALGERNEKALINVNVSSESSSLLAMTDIHHQNYPNTDKSVEKEISVRRLDDLENIVTATSKILMKIDVQGFELNVLKGAVNTLKLVEVIIIEVMYETLYDGQSTFDDLNDFLKAHNFVFSGIYDQELSPLNGKPIFADLIYVAKKS